MKYFFVTIFLSFLSISNYAQKFKLVVQEINTKKIVKLKVGRSIGLITTTDTIKYDTYKDSLRHTRQKMNYSGMNGTSLNYKNWNVGVWYLSKIDTTNHSISISTKKFKKKIPLTTKTVLIDNIHYVVFPHSYDDALRVPYFFLGAASFIIGSLEFVKGKRDLTTYGLVTIGGGLTIYVYTTFAWLHTKKYKIVRVE